MRRFRDELPAGADPVQVFGDGGLLNDLKKAVAERAPDVEMDTHPEGERSGGNHRNGHNRKRVPADEGAPDLAVPHDRAGRFKPRLVEKYCRCLPGFDDKVISMYMRGMTTREVRGHLEEPYGVSVSAEPISKVTDAVLDEVGEWRSRPLEEAYAIMRFDAVRMRVRDEGLVRNKAVHLAVGMNCAGRIRAPGARGQNGLPGTGGTHRRASPPTDPNGALRQVDTPELLRPRPVGMWHAGLWDMDKPTLTERLGIGPSLHATAIRFSRRLPPGSMAAYPCTYRPPTGPTGTRPPCGAPISPRSVSKRSPLP